jgi:CRISP-associated protein Cas1
MFTPAGIEVSGRIIDISLNPARVSLENRNLLIHTEAGGPVRVLLTELSALVLSHPQVTVTLPALAALAEAGVSVITCGPKRLPVGLQLPLVGNQLQSERFRAQARAKAPTQKRAWQQLVRAKLASQAAALEEYTEDDAGLRELGRRVRSGDPENLEAQGARRYWSQLFGAHGFRRDPSAPGINAALNYGYAIVRAVTARSLCGAGLHPTLGLHHHNRHNPLCLADDLMEPFRPLVDRVVCAKVAVEGPELELDSALKRALVGIIEQDLPGPSHLNTVQAWTQRAASSLVKIYLGKGKTLDLPRAWTPE